MIAPIAQAVKRMPLLLACKCARHAVVLPRGEGKMVWACSACGAGQEVEFGRDDRNPAGVQFGSRRRPVELECPCGQKDLIVLPLGKGTLVWSCGHCKQRWRIDFTPTTEQIAKGVKIVAPFEKEPS